MKPKLITLGAWITATYGDAVSIDTARRWVREGRILPAPQKHGRSYFVTPETYYNDSTKQKPSLVERLRAEAEISDAPRAA